MGRLRNWWSTLLCKWFGHKYVCESSIGPDSGSEDIGCTRCGKYHHITYY